MTPVERALAIRIADEIRARNEARVKGAHVYVRRQLFPEQEAFVSDPARFKSVLCSRRAGKSYSLGEYLIESCLARPGVSCLYVGLTRETARRIMVKDVLLPIMKEAGVRARYNRVELSFTFDNGSVLYLLGADSSDREMEKALGQKYALVVVDEGQSYHIDLEEFIERHLMPAVADLSGTICIAGTPGWDLHSYYYRVTTGQVPGWSRHAWNTTQNPFMRQVWLDELARLKLGNPHIEDSPKYRREYLGQWVVDDSRLVYKFHEGRNLALPQDLPTGRLHYVLGIDLGFEDDTSFSLLLYSERAPTLYVVETFKARHMYLNDISEKAKDFARRYNLDRMVIDAANKQVVQELARSYALPLHPAEKTGKEEAIERLNSDMQLGRVKVLGSCKDLLMEWAYLTWVDSTGRAKRIENPRAPNHCFVAGTLIETEHGAKPVEQIALGDVVWTRDGLRPVILAGQTGVEPIWRLETEDGHVLEGTAGHRVMTEKGPKELAQLSTDDILYAWGSTDDALRLNMRAKPFGDTPTLPTARRASTGHPSEVVAFTGCSLRTCTDRSPRASTSTTSTKTLSTTTLPISPPSPPLTTCEATTPAQAPTSVRGGWPGLRRQGLLPQPGMHLPKAVRGTVRMLARWRRTLSRCPALALFAARDSSQKNPPPACAVAHATRASDARVAKMTSSLPAQSAALSSSETVTWRPVTAPTRVLRVSPTGSVQRVYNLGVEGVHEYFANGVCVANCSDATLYAYRECSHFAFIETELQFGAKSPAQLQDELLARDDAYQRKRASVLSEEDELFGGS